MMRKVWGGLTALVITGALIGGCGGAATAPKTETQAPAQAPAAPAAPQAPAPKETKYPITVKDAAGRDVTLQAEPKRIISVAPANTELLFALGKGTTLIAHSAYDDYPAEAKQVKEIVDWMQPNFEQIVALKPDLVLLAAGSEPARDKLTKDYKITAFVVDPHNFNELYDGIKTLGVALNAQGTAEKIVAGMQQQVKEITDKTAKATSKPKVFYQVWDDPLMTAGANTFMDELIRMAGGENSGAAVQGFANFSLEQLAAANPDYILTDNAASADKAKTHKGWESFKAVKENKVLGVPDNNLVVRPGPRLVQGLRWLAETLHPDLFGK